jgi:hypothetical protein
MLVDKDRTAAAIAATCFVFVAAMECIKSIIDLFECIHNNCKYFVLIAISNKHYSRNN